MPWLFPTNMAETSNSRGRDCMQFGIIGITRTVCNGEARSVLSKFPIGKIRL